MGHGQAPLHLSFLTMYFLHYYHLGMRPLALGASAGIMAIAVATTFIAPGYRLLPMPHGRYPALGADHVICHH
jgi:hypothetical protein